jgi:hypothetical protein
MKRPLRHAKTDNLNELVLEIKLDAHCSFFVECLAEQIVNRAATSDELRRTIREAVESLHFGEPKPAVVRLHLVRDEMLGVG